MVNRSYSGHWPLLVAATVFALGLSTTVTFGADKTTLTFTNWAAAEGATRPGLEKIIQDFEKAHPDITVKSEAVSFSEIAHQLVLRVKSGNPPDVAEIAGNDTFLVALTGKLEPLNALMGSSLEKEFQPATLRDLRMDGKLIALPWTVAPVGFWYNKAIMAKAGLNADNPPKTIDELMTAMAAIKKSQPDVIPLGLDTTNRSFSMISNWPWMQTFGANPIKDGADTPAMKNYLSWMRDLAQKGYIETGRKIGEFRPLAAQGKVAFHWDQVLLQGVIQNANHMSDGDFYKTWGVTTQPAGLSGHPYAFEGGHQLIMFADSKQKKAAWEFMKYLATSPEAIKAYTIGYESSLPPVTIKAGTALAQQLDTPIFNAFSNKIIPTLVTPPYGPGFAAAATAVMAGVQQAVTSDTPIDEIANSIQRQLKRK